VANLSYLSIAWNKNIARSIILFNNTKQNSEFDKNEIIIKCEQKNIKIQRKKEP